MCVYFKYEKHKQYEEAATSEQVLAMQGVLLLVKQAYWAFFPLSLVKQISLFTKTIYLYFQPFSPTILKNILSNLLAEVCLFRFWRHQRLLRPTYL